MSFKDLESYFNGNIYIVAILIFVLFEIVLKISRKILLKRLNKWSSKSKNQLDDVIVRFFEDIQPSFYTVISIYAALKYLSFDGLFGRILDTVLIIVIVFKFIRACNSTIDFFVAKRVKLLAKGNKKLDSTPLNGIGQVVKIILWVLGGLLVLSNLGVNVNSLIAGLGIGGIAVALALQNILDDIFSSFAIYFDKPFEVGDFITIDAYSGTVEKVGIKTTRLRTLQGEQLIISNKELTTSRIQNFRRLKTRKVEFELGVDYSTPNTQLRKIKKEIKKIIDKTAHTKLYRIHFSTFGDSALLLDIVYDVDSNNFEVFLDAQEKINFEIKRMLEKEKVDIPYPTQSLYLTHKPCKKED